MKDSQDAMHISNVEFQHEGSQSEILAMTEKQIVYKLSLILTDNTNSVLLPISLYMEVKGRKTQYKIIRKSFQYNRLVLLKSMRKRTHIFHQCQCLRISGRPRNLSFIIDHRFQYSLQDICRRLYLFLQSKHIITRLLSKEATKITQQLHNSVQ